MNKYPTLFGCTAGAGGRVVIAGAPYDRGTDAHRAGCAAAPGELRRLSHPEEFRIADGPLFDLRRRAPAFPGKLVSDIGDLRHRPQDSDDAYLAFVARSVELISGELKKPVLLGGDHLITLAALRGIAAAGRPVQVIQIDAHHDYAPIEPGERPTHATFVGHVMAEGLAKQVLQIGVRGLAWGIPEAPENVRLIDPEELGAALLPDTDVYITVDTDGFDPGVAPGVGYPEPDGLPFSTLGQILARVKAAGLRVVGADWTEYNPTFDTANRITGRMILRGLAQLFEALAEN